MITPFSAKTSRPYFIEDLIAFQMGMEKPDYAKAEGYKIIPGCPYIEVKFKRKPEDRAAVGTIL